MGNRATISRDQILDTAYASRSARACPLGDSRSGRGVHGVGRLRLQLFSLESPSGHGGGGPLLGARPRGGRPPSSPGRGVPRVLPPSFGQPRRSDSRFQGREWVGQMRSFDAKTLSVAHESEGVSSRISRRASKRCCWPIPPSTRRGSSARLSLRRCARSCGAACLRPIGSAASRTTRCSPFSNGLWRSRGRARAPSTSLAVLDVADVLQLDGYKAIGRALELDEVGVLAVFRREGDLDAGVGSILWFFATRAATFLSTGMRSGRASPGDRLLEPLAQRLVVEHLLGKLPGASSSDSSAASLT